MGDEVIGSMSRKWQKWKDYGAPRLVCQWLRNGVPLKWSGSAPRIGAEQEVVQRGKELEQEMKQLVKDGAFTYPDTEEVCVSPVFMIPKRSGGMRLIHDLRSINAHLKAPHFTIHGCRDAATIVRESNWLCALDLRRGYQQVLMSREARKYLGASVGGKTVVSAVLPFGLSLSPYIFTRLTNWLAGLIRKRTRLAVAVYIDDFLIGGKTREGMEKGLQQIKDLFNELGVVLSTKKPIVIKKQAEFLGFLWSAEEKTIGVTEERRKEYKRMIMNLLRSGQPVKRWKTAVGKLIFLREAIGPTLRHVRSILRMIRGKRSGTRIEASGEVREDLIWWKEMLARTNKMSLLHKQVSASITTDASDTALAYSLELDGVRIQKTIPAQQDKHINVKELEAFLECLKEHGSLFRDRRIVWYSDSIAARAVVQRQGTQQCGELMWKVTKEVLDLIDHYNIKVVARHVPGVLNRSADALSRPLQEDEGWAVALRSITDKWGPLMLDLSGITGQPAGTWEDGAWSTTRTLLRPEIKRIPEMLETLKLVVDKEQRISPPSCWKACAVLITPTWRGALWWNILESLRTDWIDLGRLQDKRLEAWSRRNGHQPHWTASLVPTKGLSGQTEQNRAINVSR